MSIPPADDDAGVGGWVSGFLVGSNEVIASGVSSAHCPDSVQVVGWWPDLADDFLCRKASLVPEQACSLLLKRLHPTLMGVLQHLAQPLVSEPLTQFNLVYGLH